MLFRVLKRSWLPLKKVNIGRLRLVHNKFNVFATYETIAASVIQCINHLLGCMMVITGTIGIFIKKSINMTMHVIEKICFYLMVVKFDVDHIFRNKNSVETGLRYSS